MPAQRKQFGKRGLPQETVQDWRRQHTPYGLTAAYASPGHGAAAGDDDSFSILKVFGFALGMLFSFQGRIGRMEYWSIGIVRFILFVGASVAYVSMLQPSYGDLEPEAFFLGFVNSGTGMMFLFLFIALTVCQYSLEVRRFHDRDVSGLWLLLIFVPIIGGFYALWVFIANGFFPGTPGSNRFDTVQSQASVFD